MPFKRIIQHTLLNYRCVSCIVESSLQCSDSSYCQTSGLLAFDFVVVQFPPFLRTYRRTTRNYTRIICNGNKNCAGENISKEKYAGHNLLVPLLTHLQTCSTAYFQSCKNLMPVTIATYIAYSILEYSQPFRSVLILQIWNMRLKRNE